MTVNARRGTETYVTFDNKIYSRLRWLDAKVYNVVKQIFHTIRETYLNFVLFCAEMKAIAYGPANARQLVRRKIKTLSP